MAHNLNVTLLPFMRVTAIDTAARTVATSQGDVSYSRLVLATGAQPIRVPVAGDAASQVRSVNSLEDFAAFHAQLRPGAQLLVMGAGLIGCEFANDLAAAGYRVQVVDPGSRPLAALLPEAASAHMQGALFELGVQWHWGATVQSVAANAPSGGARFTVQLSNGLGVQADAVLSAIGLRADTALVQAAGIACDRGILVSTTLQTSADGIYGLGDGAQYASAGNRTLPYVMPIMQAARALAATLAGQPTELVFPLMPVAVKTPALPLVVAPPAPGMAGDWHEAEPGLWQFFDASGSQRGFVLAGKQTARRAEQAKRVSA